METGKLKTFAQAARRQLLAEVAIRLEQVLRADSVETREKKAAIAELKEQIALSDRHTVIDRIAYTWFNRFCALRFMDVNHYTRLGIVSPLEGYSQPEILQEAKQGVIDAEFKVDRQRALDILSGVIPSSDPQGEAYRLLLVGACNYYHQLMPFLFEPIEDYTELLMPDDLLSEKSVLHKMRTVLTEGTCQDVEVIGWLYQFYISERKDEVFANLKKNIKIAARDIPSATQLFTPHWIVRYLVENSLGRLWMLNHPESKLIEGMEYYIKSEQAETDFLQIASPEEIKICDPACGSGHMLTYAFDLLYAIYEEQGYDPAQIPSLILQKNLYGIEIDKRAGDLAAFALVMKARGKDRRFFSRKLEPNICVLQNVIFSESEIAEYMHAVGRDLFTQELEITLKQFLHADSLGSLIRPKLDVAYVRKHLEEKKLFENLFLHRVNEKVKQALKQAEYLAQNYHVVVTNPPYMNSSGMNDSLRVFGINNYPNSKFDTYSMFIERSINFTKSKGMLALITIPNWMFLCSFEELRNILLTKTTFISLLYCGRGVWGSDFGSCAFILTHFSNPIYQGNFRQLFIKQGEVNSNVVLQKRYFDLLKFPVYHVSAVDYSKIPGSPLAYWVPVSSRTIFDNESLDKYFESGGRCKTTNDEFYLKKIWEVDKENIGINKPWCLLYKGGSFQKYYGNREHVIRWTDLAKEFYRSTGGLTKENYWTKTGITWTIVTAKNVNAFRIKSNDGQYNSVSPTIFPISDKFSLEYFIGLLNSSVGNYLARILNPTLALNVGNVLSIPIVDIDSNVIVSKNVQRLIEITKADWDSFETSGEFRQPQILNNVQIKNGKDGIKLNKGSLFRVYEKTRNDWTRVVNNVIELEEIDNRLFIEAYGLINELNPGVPLEEITLNCNPYYRYGGNKGKEELEILLLADTMKEFISYTVGCMFGRYSLEKPGLILANQGGTAEDYYKQIPEPSFPPDEDNVIPILDEGWFNDDITERFKKFLRVTFGDEHYEENLAFIENAIGRNIRSYFLKDFYGEHLKMYKNRPIYWLFSSPNGSFNALIYMHRYRPDTVSVVLNGYLREYVRKLQAHKAHLEQVLTLSGSQAEKTKATKEINNLNKVLAELKEYEDDVLYPLATRQIQIDLDDGVKVNYAKFGKALKWVKGLSN